MVAVKLCLTVINLTSLTFGSTECSFFSFALLNLYILLRNMNSVKINNKKFHGVLRCFCLKVSYTSS